MSLTDERKKIEKNKNDLKAARAAINNKLVELGGSASTSFNDIPEKTTELADVITATNKTYIDSKTGNLNDLQTNNKNNLVGAINEIKESSSSERRLVIQETLSANKWAGNTYSFEDKYPAEKYDLEIELGSLATLEHANAFFNACLKGSLKNQSITALDVVPNIDIPIVIEVIDKTKVTRNRVSGTIYANKWAGNIYSFEDIYPIATYDIKIELGDECTLDQANAFYNACIKGNHNMQSITALDVVPTIDIPITIEAISK